MPELSPEYIAYMQSRAWLDRRAAALRDPKAACWCCGVMAGIRPLDLHHLTYERLGRELPRDLVLVCRPCHDTIHERRDKHDSILAATRYVREMQKAARERECKPFAPTPPIESRPDDRPQVQPVLPPPVRWVGGTLSRFELAVIGERNKRIKNGPRGAPSQRLPPPTDPRKWTQGKYKGRPKGERKKRREHQADQPKSG
jgi:hypothetical protein